MARVEFRIHSQLIGMLQLLCRLTACWDADLCFKVIRHTDHQLVGQRTEELDSDTIIRE